MSLHVCPVEDDHPHELTMGCDCEPNVEWANPETGEVYERGPLVTHNAFDCREILEQVSGKEQGGWGIWEE